jgi:hypothetical protein
VYIYFKYLNDFFIWLFKAGIKIVICTQKQFQFFVLKQRTEDRLGEGANEVKVTKRNEE